MRLIFTPDVIICVEKKIPQKRRHPLGNEGCAVWYPAQASHGPHFGKVEPGPVPLALSFSHQNSPSHLGFIRVNIFFPKSGKQELFSVCKQPPICHPPPPRTQGKKSKSIEKNDTEAASVNLGSASNDQRPDVCQRRGMASGR